MNEKQETRAISKDKERAKKRLLSLLGLHTQAFQSGIGAAAFVKEFINVFTKYVQFSDEEIFAMEELSQIIRDYPHIIRQEDGPAAFLDDLHKASEIYLEYFPKPKTTEN